MAREYSAASCIGRDSFQPLMGRESFCELDGGPLKRVLRVRGQSAIDVQHCPKRGAFITARRRVRRPRSAPFMHLARLEPAINTGQRLRALTFGAVQAYGLCVP